MNSSRNACEAIECWPRFLVSMRRLTTGFRNEDYGVSIQVYFRTLGQHAAAALSQRFSAGFGKWRHETICEAVCQLAPFAFAEEGFLGAFRNTRPAGLDEVCKDIDLWVFSQAVAAGRTSQARCMSRVRQQGHAVSGCFGQKHLRSLMIRLLGSMRFFSKRCMETARFWAISTLLLEIRRRTQAPFVVVGEAPIFVRQRNRSDSCGFDAEELAKLCLPRASQHPVTVRSCMLWEADLQRIAYQETDRIPLALNNEQEVFRRMRLSSVGCGAWHRSVRLVRVGSNRSRIP